MVEHFGNIHFIGLSIRTSYSNAPGGLTWMYSAGDVEVRIAIEGSSEMTYRTHVRNTYSDARLYSENLESNAFQSREQGFEQIDHLGLRWFYDRAVNVFRNENHNDPAITGLNVDIEFYKGKNYAGLTLTLYGFNESYDSHGNKVYQSVFRVMFKPDGDILSQTI